MTARYWTLQALDPSTRLNTLYDFVLLEVVEREGVFEFDSAYKELHLERARWQSRHRTLVLPDTNVYLHHDRPFDEIPWAEVAQARLDGVHLLLPLAVIDELDTHKRSQRNAKVSDRVDMPVRTRARLTLKRIDELLRPGSAPTIQPARGLESGPTTAEILLDDPRRGRLENVDDELVEIAVGVQQIADRPVKIVTFDVGMRVRAEVAGVEAIRLQD
jgi:predicted ribonuclease YlaK